MLRGIGRAGMDTAGLGRKCQVPVQSRGAHMGVSGIYPFECWLVSLWIYFDIFVWAPMISCSWRYQFVIGGQNGGCQAANIWSPFCFSL